MHNPWNPTAEEIRSWAYSSGTEEPCQDWDLALSWTQFVPLFAELAADKACPRSDFMLHMLYFMVGDAVRSEFSSISKHIIEGWLELADEFPTKELQLWAQRSNLLIKDPSIFEYSFWCCGAHATFDQLWVELECAIHRPIEGESIALRSKEPWTSEDCEIQSLWKAITATSNEVALEMRLKQSLNLQAKGVSKMALEVCRSRRLS